MRERKGREAIGDRVKGKGRKSERSIKRNRDRHKKRSRREDYIPLPFFAPSRLPGPFFFLFAARSVLCDAARDRMCGRMRAKLDVGGCACGRVAAPAVRDESVAAAVAAHDPDAALVGASWRRRIIIVWV